MKWRAYRSQIIPPPRSPLNFVAILPLLLFLTFYAVTIAVLMTNGLLEFARPAAFGLIVVSVWIWWMHLGGYGGLRGSRANIALLVRLCLLGLFVAIIAEPRAIRTRDVISVVYAIDVSESVGDSVNPALEYVAEVVTHRDKPKDDESGIVVFGRDAAVEFPPRKTPPPVDNIRQVNSLIDSDATNLEQTLSLAGAMLPQENRGRIVLVSDGIETEGSLSRILDDLKSRGIAVDVLPVEYNYNKEVWLERLDLPRMVKVGENYEASVILSSLANGKGTLRLKENDQVIFEDQVEFNKGRNRFTVPIFLRDPGYYEYAASIELARGDDNVAANNTVLNYLLIQGEGKVLVVADPTQGDSRDWEPFAKAIRESKRIVEIIDSYDFPRDALSLMPYDCIVFANVPSDAFDTIQLDAVHNAVRDLGIGFMMVGGENSFGPGGYHRTPIEEALPVSMDIKQKKVLPKGALAIILHTCEFPEGNTWGKRIAKQAIKVLSSRDEVGILVYGANGEEWLFELTPAGDYDKLVPKINSAVIGDMPSFVRTMSMGLTALKASDAATKHMIIISDGDPTAPPPATIQGFINNKISVSMVAIYPHGGQDISKMRAISNATGGRYYFPSDPRTLPSIFIKEAKTLRRSMIQNKSFLPEIGFPSPIIKGITAMPPLHGYVLTSAKSRSESILNTPPEKSEETGAEEIDPVLSTWKYGLGTTAAFTSDLSANWGKDWIPWNRYQPFVEQLITRISRSREPGHLQMWSTTSGNKGLITIEDFHPNQHFLEMQTVITGPRDQSETVTLTQVGPRRYQGEVQLWGEGRYQILSVGKDGEREDRAYGGLIVPYSPEYLRFQADPLKLQTIADRTGGQNLKNYESKDAVNEIYGRRDPKKSSRPVFDWLIIALLCLIPIDVGVRRIQIDWYGIRKWFVLEKEPAETTATMATLLKRKESVDTKFDQVRTDSAARLQDVMKQRVSSESDQKTSGEAKTPQTNTNKPSKEQPADTSSTTGRLLDLKRKREQHEEDD